MPPVIFLAIIGAAGFAGYKLLSALVHQAAHQPARKDAPDPRTARNASPQVRDLGNLEWDESAGVYRPREERES